MRTLFRFFVAAGFAGVLAAAEPAPATNPAYRKRSEKIVATLGLGDAARIARVTAAVADHYADTNAVHAETKLTARAEAAPKLAALHARFLEKLAADLTPDQIDLVKDGLTYGVLPLTFRVYREMLPDLTTDQKTQILTWLTAAREQAMDAGSAEEKHAWFGKYKGRINNYLSAAG